MKAWSADDGEHQVWPVRVIAVLGVALFLWAYLPSANIPFRVEQWDCYHFYRSYPFDVTRVRDWGLVAFWTPFGDFRPIPFAYIWNFVVFSVLGTHNLLHWALSIALTLVNALLLARWVSALRSHRGLDHGLIAATLFLLMPANHEIVIWTFFTYKLAYTALVLGCLIAFEQFLATRHWRSIYLSTACLVGSWLFYEASLPIAFVLPIRMVLSGHSFTPQEKRKVLLILGMALTSYAALYLAAARWIPGIYNLVQEIPRQQTDLSTFFVSLWRWTLDGVLLGNSGLPLTSVTYPFHLGVRVITDPAILLIVSVVWAVLLLQLRWRPFPLRDLAYLGAVAGAGSVLVLIGRTMTNGPNYLQSFSIYQHFPTIMLAAMLGYLTDRSRVVRKRIVVAVLLVCALLGISSRQAVDEYMYAQEPLIQTLAAVDQALRSSPEGQLYVGDIRLPFAPTWSIPSAEHSYHAFHLLHGDRITRHRPPSR